MEDQSVTERLLTLGTWRIWYDQTKNQEIYARIPTGSCEDCKCDGCKWFAENRENFYPKSFLNLLEKLGIDYRKEAELITYGDAAGENEPRGGLFHLLGHIESGDETLQYLDSNFCLDMNDDQSLLQDQFEGLATVKLEWSHPSTPPV